MGSPWSIGLPSSLEIGGRQYEIRTDYRCALDVISAYRDPELEAWEKLLAALEILVFAPGWEDIPREHFQEAAEKCVWFLDGGDMPETRRTGPEVISWEQDFRLIAPPINRVMGLDIRSVPYDPDTNTGGLHWWSFLGAYMEIGDCLFSQVVRIRDRKARGKKLDKTDQEFYRQNREIIDIKKVYTSSEEDLLKEWGAL